MDRLFFCRADGDASTILVPESQFGNTLSRTTVLDAAQLLTLDMTPVVLVPSPGNGLATVVTEVAAVVAVNGGDGFSTGGSGQVDIKYPNTSVIVTPFSSDTAYNADNIQYLRDSAIAGLPDSTPADSIGDVTVAVTGDANTIDEGAIVTSAKNAAGTGYAIGDLIYVDSTDAVLKVLTLSTTAVGTYSRVNSGTNVPVANGQTTTSSGAGTGFTLDVTVIDATKNLVKVALTVYYKIVNTLLN